MIPMRVTPANDDDLRIPLVTVRPVDLTDATFPEMELARRHWMNLPPERRALIEREWG